MRLIHIGAVLLGLCFAGVLGQTGCNSQPSQNLKNVSAGCEQDVGSCSMRRCFQCIPLNPKCCRPVSEDTTVECPGGLETFSRVIECKCLPCEDEQPVQLPTVVVAGTITGCGGGCPSWSIEINNEEVASVKSDGTFVFTTNYPANDRLSFIAVEELNNRLPLSKVIETTSGIQAYTVDLTVVEGLSIPSFDATAGTSVGADVDGNVQIIFQGGSFTNSDGTPYTGSVSGTMNFIDPNDVDQIPAPLLVAGDGSGPQMLSSSGMIQLALTDSSGNLLNADGVQLSLQTTGLSPEEIAALGIYVFNPETVLWELVSSLTADAGRKKRGTSNDTIISGAINVRGASRIWNLDALVSPYCYVKVRLFLNNIEEAAQIRNQRFRAYYYRAGATNAANYLRTFSNSNGACVQIQCNANILGKATIIGPAGSKTGNIVLPSTTDTLFSATKNDGYFTIDMITSDTAVLPNGPVYSSFSNCNNAPFTDYYFQFFRSEPENALIEENAVDIDEDNIFSTWTDNVLSWWPNITRFRACYMKVEVDTVNSQNTFKIQSLGGTHSVTAGKGYGNRTVNTLSKTACVEYKCPDTLSDGEYDRTMIVVTVSNYFNSSHKLVDINTSLYSSADFATISDQLNNTYSFTALVPILESAYGNGVFFAENIHPTLAKEAALESCSNSSIPAITFQRDTTVDDDYYEYEYDYEGLY